MSNLTADNVAQLFNCVNGTSASKNDEPVQSPSKVDDLALSIQKLKADMAVLKKELDEKESELVLICGHEEEGSSKFNTENFVITTTGKLTRKIIDETAISGLAPDVLRTKVELDLRKLKSLATSNPMLYRKVASCLETKPAKTALKIEPAKAAS
jgi:hypothetical protein